MRVWIEIVSPVTTPSTKPFHPLMRVWIEMKILKKIKPKIPVSPSYEGVD